MRLDTTCAWQTLFPHILSHVPCPCNSELRVSLWRAGRAEAPGAFFLPLDAKEIKLDGYALSPLVAH